MRAAWIVILVGCGGNDPMMMIDAPKQIDASTMGCQPQGAIGSFYRRMPNPRIVAGHQTYTDGMVDVGIADPDLRWDDASASWQLYFHGPHAMTFADTAIQMIRHASSPDLAAWTIDDAPSLVAATGDAAAWDHLNTETPSVAYNPDAAPDRRYLLMYSGANGNLAGHNFAGYAIGAAFSADGHTFTRVSAAESPHGKAGLVLTAADVYPLSAGGLVADPDIIYVNGTYQMWFSSYACDGTNCAGTTAFGIGHATSTDGIHWAPGEVPVRSLLRASADKTTGGKNPSIIYDDVHCRWEMWLTSDTAGETDVQPVVFNNMVGVWHATSTDALTWTINYTGQRDLAWNANAPDAGEHLGLLTGADIAAKGTARYMVYDGFDDQNVPSGYVLPDHSAQPGYRAGVMTLNVATRDAP